MNAAIAIAMMLIVVLFVVFPLMTATQELLRAPVLQTGRELWRREKAVAVLAITEADFDRATGKLSDDDYRVLRSDYEGRALHAMDEIDKTVAVVTPAVGHAVRFCASCGTRFGESDAFCGGCGVARAAG